MVLSTFSRLNQLSVLIEPLDHENVLIVLKLYSTFFTKFQLVLSTLVGKRGYKFKYSFKISSNIPAERGNRGFATRFIEVPSLKFLAMLLS